MFSEEAAVVPFLPETQSTKEPQQGFFFFFSFRIYNNFVQQQLSCGEKSRLNVLSHHEGFQLKYQSPSKKRIDLREPDSGL